MTDLSHTHRFKAHWTEKMPEPPQLTDTERLDFFGEHCDEYKYVPQTSLNIGHHVLICDGQKTVASSFRDAVDMAAGKWEEVNS